VEGYLRIRRIKSEINAIFMELNYKKKTDKNERGRQTDLWCSNKMRGGASNRNWSLPLTAGYKIFDSTYTNKKIDCQLKIQAIEMDYKREF
jgi:hypothetical protein